MNHHKINTRRLFADMTIENDIPTNLVFYEKNIQDNIICSWGTDLTPDGYQVVNGIIEYPRRKLQGQEIDENKIAHLEVPLYNTALYFFNCTSITEDELYSLEEKLIKLYENHHENFQEYINETFASVDFKHSKYFFSAYLIQELAGTFQVLECLQKKEAEPAKKFVLEMR